MVYLWISGKCVVYYDFFATPIWSVSWLLFVIYWRDFHFYFAHRIMHPWFRKKKWFDIGAFLYRHAHSLHHKSYNTGPWSGLSMHPYEHLLYFSCVFCPSILGISQHPIHFLFNHWHVLISPLPGHDGFDQPGGGSYFHYLHHAHFECNYGTPMVPLDKWFGSYEDGTKYINKKDEDKDKSTKHVDKDDKDKIHLKCKKNAVIDGDGGKGHGVSL